MQDEGALALAAALPAFAALSELYLQDNLMGDAGAAGGAARSNAPPWQRQSRSLSA